MSVRARLLALTAALVAAPSFAQAEEPPAEPMHDDSAAIEPRGAVSHGEPTVRGADVETERRRKARMRCGCASPRLLRRGSEVTLGDGQALAAWLRDDGEASLTYFTKPEGGASVDVMPPVREQTFTAPSTGEWVHTPARLMRVFPTAASEPFYVGVEVLPRKIPGDVVLARVEGADGVGPSAGPAPDLEEVWVGALVDRQTAACGHLRSRRLWTTAAEGAEPVAAFLVEYTPVGGATRATLVDERHARIFGLGRVDPCEHGMPLDDGPGEISVRAVGETFGVGPAWRFSLPADPVAMPSPLSLPEGKTLDADENPFLKEPRDPLEDLLDDDADHAAMALMAFVVIGAAAFAQLFYRGRRKRKPHVVDTTCPSCKAQLSLDLNDPETDGMFCPKCGCSSVFVAFEADGTPKAKVILLEKDGRPGATSPGD